MQIFSINESVMEPTDALTPMKWNQMFQVHQICWKDGNELIAIAIAITNNDKDNNKDTQVNNDDNGSSNNDKAVNKKNNAISKYDVIFHDSHRQVTEVWVWTAEFFKMPTRGIRSVLKLLTPDISWFALFCVLLMVVKEKRAHFWNHRLSYGLGS